MRVKDATSDRVTFSLLPTEETRKVWNHEFVYNFGVTLREDCMEWDVGVINKGTYVTLSVACVCICY